MAVFVNFRKNRGSFDANCHFPKGQRNNMVALGSLNVVAERPKRGSWVKIEEKSPIGIHLLKRRLELGLLQREVAAQLNVCEDSIVGWEKGRSLPQIRHYPALINFLGYNPFGFQEKSLGERVKMYRLASGLNYKSFGKLLCVNASTVRSWEKGGSRPKAHAIRKLEALMRKRNS